MSASLLFVLALLVTSVVGDCGGGRWPSHVYQEQTELLEDDEVISRDKTTFQVTKSKKETFFEESSKEGTTFEDIENEEVVNTESRDGNIDPEDDAMENSFDEEVGEGFQSFSGINYDDIDDYDRSEPDDWTKKHMQKIKGLRLLQNVTQDLEIPQSGSLVCWTNVCHEIDIVIHRVEIVATPGVIIQCLDGGVGSYKMAFEVKGQGGVRGHMTAKMWGSYVAGHRYIWVTSGDTPYQCAQTIAHC